MPTPLLLSAASAASFSLHPVPAPGLDSSLRSQLTQQRHVQSIRSVEPDAALREAPWRICWQGEPDSQDTPSSDDAVPKFGAEGSLRWSVLGGFGVQVVEPRNKEAYIGLGLQYFIVDGFAFAPELRMWGFFQSGEDSMGGSLDLLFQWHIIQEETWSFFGDFGCGMLGTQHNVPDGGSEFNFTPQAGIGFTFDVGDNRRAIIGVKWHHISNASLYRNNPGRDSILVWGGLNMPF